MEHPVLRIVDFPFQVALWVFLVSFLIILLVVRYRIRARKFSLKDYFREEFDRYYREKLEDASGKPRRTEPWTATRNEFRIVFQLMLLSILLAAGSFVGVSFVPLPYLKNWTGVESIETAPLRIVALSYDRFYTGFSLKGEIWNQGEIPLKGLSARVRIWGRDDELLEEIMAKVKPDVLNPESSGNFGMKFSGKSPAQLYGYEVAFVDPDGVETPHIRGFDAP